ncbi:hypothetical protein FBZ96_105592 [Bradyrhizobium stylosanthis]|uniref:Porin n=1 Tax=Bradyrhizobium stylosanthis TaxID=1803665 RepID=A0A560DP68_9BRAD|nr:hypothetical protein FBZ96_105592 [Bradyrhizobium stylosanthis]
MAMCGQSTIKGTGQKKKAVLLLGTIALIALAGPVSAADLAEQPSIKALPMVARIYDCRGFYIGIDGGGGSAHQCWDVVNAGSLIFAPPLAIGCHNATGGTAGGQVGYRWQIANSVFGLEAQGISRAPTSILLSQASRMNPKLMHLGCSRVRSVTSGIMCCSM